MKLKLDKKKLKNLSVDAQQVPVEATPQIAGGVFTFDCGLSIGACGTVMSEDWGCDATGSCGCVSDPREGNCNTNTCY